MAEFRVQILNALGRFTVQNELAGPKNKKFGISKGRKMDDTSIFTTIRHTLGPPVNGA